MITAQVVLLNKEGLVLGVSRKTDHNDFGLPGGKMDPEDNGDPMITAIRETKEETGLNVFNLRLVFAIHKGGNMGYTYMADYDGEINHNEPHVVKWLPMERLVNGSFGKYNKMVSESLTDMNISYVYSEKFEEEELEARIENFITNYFKDSDIEYDFIRKEIDRNKKTYYNVFLTCDEPEILDEALDMPDSFDEALNNIGKPYGVRVMLSSDYTSK